jgi:hypothetical protein
MASMSFIPLCFKLRKFAKLLKQLFTLVRKISAEIIDKVNEGTPTSSKDKIPSAYALCDRDSFRFSDGKVNSDQ